jgi:hypothetical protein
VNVAQGDDNEMNGQVGQVGDHNERDEGEG